MNWPWLIVLLAGAFTLATALEPRFRQWSQRKAPARSLLAAVLGDSRRLFANHFFIKSDIYLHSGYYPSIFDRQEETRHAAAETAGARETQAQAGDDSDHEHGEQCLHDFLGKPRNWIGAFGRNFYPARHTHLGEGENAAASSAREILPWMKLAAELNPQMVETYTVGAFWLRQLKKNEEAVQFLREGLRANPDSYEILLELGRCYWDNQDLIRARNLWELALRRWQEQEPGKAKPNHFLLSQMLVYLARLEVRDHHRPVAIGYLETLKKISPFPEEVQKRIDEVRAGQPFEAQPTRR